MCDYTIGISASDYISHSLSLHLGSLSRNDLSVCVSVCLCVAQELQRLARECRPKVLSSFHSRICRPCSVDCLTIVKIDAPTNGLPFPSSQQLPLCFALLLPFSTQEKLQLHHLAFGRTLGYGSSGRVAYAKLIAAGRSQVRGGVGSRVTQIQGGSQFKRKIVVSRDVYMYIYIDLNVDKRRFVD